MVARESAEVRSDQTLPRGFVLAHLRPDRSASDRGMYHGRQARRRFPTSNAQVHLDADPARRLAMKRESNLWLVMSRPDRLPNWLLAADALAEKCVGGIYFFRKQSK